MNSKTESKSGVSHLAHIVHVSIFITQSGWFQILKWPVSCGKTMGAENFLDPYWNSSPFYSTPTRRNSSFFLSFWVYYPVHYNNICLSESRVPHAIHWSIRKLSLQKSCQTRGIIVHKFQTNPFSIIFQLTFHWLNPHEIHGFSSPMVKKLMVQSTILDVLPPFWWWKNHVKSS
jgi:hypothetical protein